jgi:hypothetical protein
MCKHNILLKTEFCLFSSSNGTITAPLDTDRHDGKCC